MLYTKSLLAALAAFTAFAASAPVADSNTPILLTPIDSSRVEERSLDAMLRLSKRGCFSADCQTGSFACAEYADGQNYEVRCDGGEWCDWNYGCW